MIQIENVLQLLVAKVTFNFQSNESGQMRWIKIVFFAPLRRRLLLHLQTKSKYMHAVCQATCRKFSWQNLLAIVKFSNGLLQFCLEFTTILPWIYHKSDIITRLRYGERGRLQRGKIWRRRPAGNNWMWWSNWCDVAFKKLSALKLKSPPGVCTQCAEFLYSAHWLLHNCSLISHNLISQIHQRCKQTWT